MIEGEETYYNKNSGSGLTITLINNLGKYGQNFLKYLCNL